MGSVERHDLVLHHRKDLLMKRFACGDVVPGCDATFVCDTEDDILAQVAQHAAEVHGMTEIPASVVVQVRERILADA